jgi:two-component system phosphate regulon sensor histidine kinase PhoR
MSLIEAIQDPVLIVAQGRVREANAAARSLLGAHVTGADVRLALRHPGALDRLADPDDALTAELAGFGGRDRVWEMRLGTLENGARLVHLIDRTFRHAAERARVDFVANASHELRTPLAAILGYCETLEDESAGGDAATRARFLGVIKTEARRMLRLTEDLMSLSRIEAEKHQAPSDPVALADIVEQVRGEIRDRDGNRQGRIQTEIAQDLPTIAGDRPQLVQLVHNLVSNALSYGRPDTPVTIALTSPDVHSVRLSVTDQGEGIAPEHLPRLTERFYRVDQARSRAGGGTGLGLAIVKHIVQHHRGELDIASEVGVGTTVSVTFPARA